MFLTVGFLFVFTSCTLCCASWRINDIIIIYENFIGTQDIIPILSKQSLFMTMSLTEHINLAQQRYSYYSEWSITAHNIVWITGTILVRHILWHTLVYTSITVSVLSKLCTKTISESKTTPVQKIRSEPRISTVSNTCPPRSYHNSNSFRMKSQRRKVVLRTLVHQYTGA